LHHPLIIIMMDAWPAKPSSFVILIQLRCMMILALLCVVIALLVAILYALLKLYRRLPGQFKTLSENLSWAMRVTTQQSEGRAYLSRLLGLELGDLPPLGGWAASADFLVILAEHILREKPEIIVEFGSGVSTITAARCIQINKRGRLITYDHDAFFAGTTRERAMRLGLEVDIRVVPLSANAGFSGKWYEVSDLPDRIDLIVVDGPPIAIHPETRGGAGLIIPRLSTNGVVLLDDAQRAGEKAIVERWRRDFPTVSFTYLGTEKGTVIGINSNVDSPLR
jgi:predicted O-methyltransferase YrrM